MRVSFNEIKWSFLGLSSAGFMVVVFGLRWLCPITALAQSKSQEAAATVQFQPTPPPETASQVSFTGNHTFDSKQLRDALADPLLSIQRQGLSLPLADDTAYYTEVFYRRHGFPNVNVTYRVSGSSLELNITEGHQYGLGTIHFEGNHSFPDKSLQDYMIGTTRARGTQFQKQLPFVQADLETGAGLLKNFYVSQGFPNVQIAPLKYTFDDVRSLVDVAVPITEGEKFVFGGVTFSGVPERAIPGLKSKISSLTNPPKPFSQSALVTLQHDLIFELKHYGYATAQVNVDADINTARNGAVPFKVSVEAGPIYRFGRIIVQQQPKARVKPDFLPNRFAELTGHIYDPIKLQQLDTEMITTGLYDSLDIQETAERDNTLQLTLTPIEGKQKYFSIFGGYDTFYGIIFGGSFSDRNVLGEGQIFSASAEITSRGPKGKISYEDPWFLNTKLDFLAEVGIEDQNLYGYTYVDEYARLNLTAKYGKTLTTGAKEYQSGIFVLLRNANVSQISITPETLVGPTGYELVTVGLTQSIDERDNPLNPRKGWILELAASDSELLRNYVNYISLTERFSVYVPIGPTVLGAGVRFGTIIPSEGGFLAIPIEERLFNGGATTVRSFLERELGPKDFGNNPIGGLARSVFNIEDDFPIYAGIIGAVFFDSGGLGNSPFDHFSTGIGLGLRYNLPVGPIRVDYGINPAPAKGDSFGAFNLSFGFAF
ncbi:MAG: BamA/TamA family outer membrane protein [Verrucomicrobia bacterium]|nr:BamA/TamA family outer membrane protein [Verrucomicrobiota bacterium]